jgi:hypothetical protein
MSDTTQADRKAELAFQDHIVAEVARAAAEELPKLGGVTTTEAVPVERSEVRTTELAPKRGK